MSSNEDRRVLLLSNSQAITSTVGASFKGDVYVPPQVQVARFRVARVVVTHPFQNVSAQWQSNTLSFTLTKTSTGATESYTITLPAGEYTYAQICSFVEADLQDKLDNSSAFTITTVTCTVDELTATTWATTYSSGRTQLTVETTGGDDAISIQFDRSVLYEMLFGTDNTPLKLAVAGGASETVTASRCYDVTSRHKALLVVCDGSPMGSCVGQDANQNIAAVVPIASGVYGDRIEYDFTNDTEWTTCTGNKEVHGDFNMSIRAVDGTPISEADFGPMCLIEVHYTLSPPASYILAKRARR